MSVGMLKKNINAIIKDSLFTLPLLKERLYADPLFDTTRLQKLVGDTTHFCLSLQDRETGAFKFAHHSTMPDLYSTSYAISLLGLTGNLDKLTADSRTRIRSYLLGHQDDDGLFRDPVIRSQVAETGQGWGWQHLLPHILIALDYLGGKPEKDMFFSHTKFADQSAKKWINDIFMNDYLLASNHYMNTVIALQYSRDYFNNGKASEIIFDIHQHTKKQLLPNLMNGLDQKGRLTRSRIIKTMYHIIPTMIYDNQLNLDEAVDIAKEALKTQNWLGGYGVSVVSDACEDIDSAYTLAMAAKTGVAGCSRSLQRFMAYVCVNRNPDGGFVFRRYMPFRYADTDILSAPRNVSHLFATWFRILSIAFVDQTISDKPYDWQFSKMPGYQYFPDNG